MRRLVAGLAPLAALAIAAPAAADNRLVAPDSTARVRSEPATHRTFTWVPRPASATDWFAITEVGMGGGLEENENFLVTSIGVMRNVHPRWAVGASLDGYTVGDGRGVVSVRGRRWIGKQQSIELSLGWTRDPADHGLAAPITTARYAPLPLVFAQVGVAPVRELRYVGPPLYTARSTRMRAFYGGGFAGPMGGVVMVAEIAVVAYVIAVWANSD